MSQIDPQMALMSLARNAMQPPLPDGDPALQDGALLASYKQRAQTTARPSPGGYGAPLGNHINAAHQQHQAMAQQQNPYSQQMANPFSGQGPAQPQQAAQQAMPTQTPAAPPSAPGAAGQGKYADYTADGSNVGKQANGGWNVEEIHGGQRSISAFDQNGNPTQAPSAIDGMMSALNPQQQQIIRAYHQANGGNAVHTMQAIHQLMQSGGGGGGSAKQPTFDQANQENKFSYDDSEKQIGHLQKKQESSPLAPDEQRQLQHHQANMQQRGRLMNTWQENQDAGLKNVAADQDVAQAAQSIHQPVQSGPNAGGQGNNTFNRATPTQRLASWFDNQAQHPGQVDQGYPGAPRPPKQGAKPSQEDVVKMYQMSGGDPAKAKEMAAKLGWG